MIKDVMTFLPKPERNGIWVLRIGTTGRAKTNASISTLAATCTTTLLPVKPIPPRRRDRRFPFDRLTRRSS